MLANRRIIAVALDADGSSYGKLTSDFYHLLCSEYLGFCLQHPSQFTAEDAAEFSTRMQTKYTAFLAQTAEKQAEEVMRCIGDIIGYGHDVWPNQAYTKLERYHLAYRQLLASIKRTNPIWLNELFAAANFVIRDYTAALAMPGDFMLVGSFSNRLYQSLDRAAMKQNFTHSFFHDLPYFSLSMREFFRQQNIDVLLNPVLLTDVVAELAPGEYMMSTLTGSKEHTDVKCIFDHSKVSSTLLIAQNLANRFPHEKIRLIVLEDKDDIIKKLVEIFDTVQALLPDNVELDVCRLLNGLTHIKLIPGTGRINPHYARDIRHLLALAKYHSLLENPRSASVDVYQGVDFREFYAYQEFSAGRSIKRVKTGSHQLYEDVFYVVLRYIIHHHGMDLLDFYRRLQQADNQLTSEVLDNFREQMTATLNDFSAASACDHDEVKSNATLSKIYKRFHRYFNAVAPNFIARILYFVHKEFFIDIAAMAEEDEDIGVLIEPRFTLKAHQKGYIAKHHFIEDLHYLTYFLNDDKPPVYFFLDRRFTDKKLYHEIKEYDEALPAHAPVDAQPNPQNTHLTYNSLINLFRKHTRKEKKLPEFRKYASASY